MPTPLVVPRSLSAVNALPAEQQQQWYADILPPSLLHAFGLNPQTLADAEGRPLLTITGSQTPPNTEVDLRPFAGAEDPLFYGHLSETLNGQLLVLLVVVNDPASPRFDTDRLPDGSSTDFGVFKRNLAAEAAALDFGLAPGQVRRGLRVLKEIVVGFERLVSRLGHDIYFTEPLSYHNAVIFERYGFAYQQGRRFMESINFRFSPDGDLRARLDGATPFRQPEFARTIRGRSWAIHDSLMGEPFTGVRMYKVVGKNAGLATFPGGIW